MSQVVVVNSIHRPLNRFRCVDAVPESDRGETEQDGDGTMKEKKRERSDEIQKIKADILVAKKVHHAQATYHPSATCSSASGSSSSYPVH